MSLSKIFKRWRFASSLTSSLAATLPWQARQDKLRICTFVGALKYSLRRRAKDEGVLFAHIAIQPDL